MRRRDLYMVEKWIRDGQRLFLLLFVFFAILLAAFLALRATAVFFFFLFPYPRMNPFVMAFPLRCNFRTSFTVFLKAVPGREEQDHKEDAQNQPSPTGRAFDAQNITHYCDDRGN
jgi:hypothetical protein